MTLLELVNAARIRSGIRSGALATVVGATGADADLVTWVQDSWRSLQRESLNWWFRAKLDLTLAISASDDEYDMPTGLETLNYRTVTIYLTAKTDESNVIFVPYEDWRMRKDTVTSGEGRPNIITERPDGVLQVWPVPDQAYTLRFDGVWDIDEMTADADTPGDTISGGTQLLPDRYHFTLVWAAVVRYAEFHEDEASHARAQARFLAERARLSERQTPPPAVAIGRLTGANINRRRGWY